jgi:hypothetical protein
MHLNKLIQVSLKYLLDRYGKTTFRWAVFFVCLFMRFWWFYEYDRLQFDRPLWLVSDWLIDWFFWWKKKKGKRTGIGWLSTSMCQYVHTMFSIWHKYGCLSLFFFLSLVYPASASWYLYRCRMIRQAITSSKPS